MALFPTQLKAPRFPVAPRAGATPLTRDKICLGVEGHGIVGRNDAKASAKLEGNLLRISGERV